MCRSGVGHLCPDFRLLLSVAVFIPSGLAYGDSGRPPRIGGGDALIFTMEIVKIKGAKVPKKTKAEL